MQISLRTFLALLCFSGFGLASLSAFQKAPKTFTIRGRTMAVSPHCGGDELSPEEMAKSNTPHPVGNMTICIKRGQANSSKSPVYKKVTSDAKGFFEVQLPEGTYCLVRESKTQKLLVPGKDWDAECLREEYKKCDLTLTVKDARRDTIAFVQQNYCPWNTPCLTFKGDPPPSDEK